MGSNINMATVVLGTQWGDEGKGKIIDLLALTADVVCRVQGGENAGRTVVVDGKSFTFHILPSCLMSKTCKALIGPGCVIHVPSLFKELATNEEKGLTWLKDNLMVSTRAQLVFDFQLQVDGMQEEELRGSRKIGTTKRGIGLQGIRVGELIGDEDNFVERFQQLAEMYQTHYPNLDVDVKSELERYKELREKLRPMVKDGVHMLHRLINSPTLYTIVVEGANGTCLDMDFGTYPLPLPSNCTTGGVCAGLGIPTSAVGTVIGVVKAYTTRIGAGPFPTEQDNEIGNKLQERGREFGTTTGRRMRCGWLDLVMVRYARVVNGLSRVALTKLDILDDFDEIKIGVSYSYKGQQLPFFPGVPDVLKEVEVEYLTMPGWKTSTVNCRAFEDMPINAQNYVRKIETILAVPIKWIGVGQSRDSIIQIC